MTLAASIISLRGPLAGCNKIAKDVLKIIIIRRSKIKAPECTRVGDRGSSILVSNIVENDSCLASSRGELERGSREAANNDQN